jgi:hypothetical protein
MLKKKKKYVIGILLVVVVSSLVLASLAGLVKFARASSLTVSLSVTGNTQNMHPGDNLTFTANVSGGQSPYSYRWAYFSSGGSPNPVPDDTNVFVFTADSWHTGTFTVTVTVHDYLGADAFDSYTPITVVPEYPNDGLPSVALLSLLLVSVSLIVIFVKKYA